MNTESKSLEQVKKNCSTASRVVNVISLIVTLLMLCAFAGAGLCFIFHGAIDEALANSPDVAENLRSSINILGMNFSVSGSDNMATKYGATLIAAGLALVFLKIALTMIRRIFYVILNSASPFDAQVLLFIRKTFIVLTVFVALSAGIVIALFLGLFLWCIYSIFQYGSALQEQVDETL